MILLKECFVGSTKFVHILYVSTNCPSVDNKGSGSSESSDLNCLRLRTSTALKLLYKINFIASFVTFN